MERQQSVQTATTWREALMASALDAIIVMDTEGVIREFNRAAQETFGYSHREAVGQTVAQTIVPEELRDAHWRGLQRYLATGDGPILNRHIEIEGQRKDGQRFPVELTIVPFEADGQRLFAGYLRDLSQAKVAEAEIERANQVALLLREIPLRASRADSFHEAAQVALEQVCLFAKWPVGHVYVRDRKRDVLTPQGIWYLEDPQRFAKFREVTDRTELSLGQGLPGRAWEKDGPQWVQDVHLDPGFTRAQAAKDLGVRSGLAVPIPVGGRTEAVLEFYTQDTREPDKRLMDLTEALVHELGRVLERQRHRQELRTANEELERMAARRADFLNLAAHELKNPLTPLSLQLQMLRRAGPLNGQQEQSLLIVDRSVTRLRRIVDDLLEGARAQSGTLAIDREMTDMAEVAQQVVRTYEHEAEESGVTLRHDVVDDAVAFVDPRRVAQVMDNLVSNAIKFTPEGGTVRIRVGIDQDEAFLEVEDDGVGIDPEDHARLFQPYSQVHAQSQKLGGSGLGLYVCQAIMEAHGGRMGVESCGDGTGTVFWARWPARRPDGDDESPR